MPRKVDEESSVHQLELWLDERIARLLALADEFLLDLPSTGRAALLTVMAAEALVRTRRQDQRVYATAIEHVRRVARHLQGVEALAADGERTGVVASAEALADGYRELVLRMNPRAVIGDLL